MTKILNLALKIKGVVGRVAQFVKSSHHATPPPKKKIWNVHHMNSSFCISTQK